MIKMLLLPPYFFPEKMASTHLDKDRFDTYSRNGICTVVYAPKPTRGVDKETRDAALAHETMFNGTVEVHRFNLMREGSNTLLRALRYFLSNAKQYHLGAKAKDIQIIYSGSTPPTQGLLCGMVKRKLSKKYGKKVPYVLCLQDIFPDSLVNAKMTTRGSLIWRIGRRIEDYTYRSADKIIVISQGFKNNIMKKGVPESKIEVISNWIDLDEIHPVERCDNALVHEYGIDPGKFIVVYAGNFGAAQGAEIVLKVARQLESYNDIQFVIFGGGVFFEQAKSEARSLSNVTIDGLKSEDRISEVYSLGDVSLITCKKGTGNAGLPSKLWSIMACNTNIIASFDLDSDLSTILFESGAGKAVAPEDEDQLKDGILKEYENWKTKQVEIKDFRGYVAEHASKESCVGQYIDVLKSAVEDN